MPLAALDQGSHFSGKGLEMIQPAKNRLSEPFAEMAQAPMEAIQEALQSTQEAIEENPGTAVLTAFAVGLGLGIGVACLLSSAPAASTYSTWARRW